MRKRMKNNKLLHQALGFADLLSAQKNKTSETVKTSASFFNENVKISTVTVGAPPPAEGNTLTWVSTVKDSPLPIKYSLESIENLFTERYMNSKQLEDLQIDYQRIKEKVEATKKEYCEHLKS